MSARTTWRWALTLVITALVACELPTRPPVSVDALADLTVSPKVVTLQQYQSADFTAIGFTSAGDTANASISWSATSGSITDTATNNGKHLGRYKAGSDTGKVKVVAKGNPGGPSDTAIVTVTPATVATVAVSPATASLVIGQTVQLVATPLDVSGNGLSGRVVTWSSTNPGVAMVNGSGLVTGVASGAATVMVACEGQSSPVAITVTVVPVASISVSPASANVIVGQTAQLTATPKDANGNALTGRTVTWATSSAAVAAVSGTGLVTGGAAGTATITASSEGRNGTATITVTLVPVASVSVSPSSATVMLGQTVQLTATPKDANGSPLTGRSVTWASSAPGVANVSASGLVTGVAAGTATLTATSEGKNGTATITVTVVPVAAVAVSPASPSIRVGGTVQLSATAKDSAGNVLTGRVVTWASSAPGVANVSASGLVTGVAAGTATLTATSEGKNGTATVTVTIAPVASVTVSPASPSIRVGGTVQLSATTKDSAGNVLTGRVVTWVSSTPAVATVNGSGLVTGVTTGSATITATSEGKSGTAAVTVTAAVTNPGTVGNLAAASVTTNSITLSFTEVTDGAGQPASYDIRYATGALSWASANSVAEGTCTVPVTGTAIGATRTCTVLGLASGTSYQFQLVAFRGTLNAGAVFGGFSNIASGTTTSSTAPVASVGVSPATGSVVVGQTLQLAAILKDASGNTLTGRSISWASNFPLLVSVNGTGLVSGVLVGVATITATSEGQSGSAIITVVVSSPSGEPVFNTGAGHTAIYQDNMDQYTTPHDMDSWPGLSLHPFYPDLYPDNYAVITSAHGSSGKALRLIYTKGNGDRFIWKTNPEDLSTWYGPASAAFVVQYWFRISKNGGPGGGPGYGSTAVGMKWIEFWRLGGGARTQFSVTAGNGTTGPLWHVNAASRGPVGYQPVGPYWNQVNNNQWHRVTYLYQPASSAGATDGIARMWLDGTKIVDVSAAAAGITPPGGTKVWCTLAEVALLDTYQTGMINLGEYMNGGLGDGVTDLPMALDFDDFMWWKLPARVS